MLGRIVVLPAVIFFLSAFFADESDWETKPFVQWSAEQADALLSRSPWIGQSAATSVTRGFNDPYPVVPLVYHARLLTAKPVREALLRLISLGITGATVDAKDFDPEGKTQKEQERVEEFVKLNPNDLRVRGNGLYIIIGVTLKEAYWGWTKEESYQSDPISQPHYDPKAGPYLFYRERVKGDELSNVDLSKIYADTSLSVSAGRRVDLVRYNPPDADRLGAKFFFPRNLPDGTSFIRTDDKELWFKTRLNGVNVRVKFNLDKMSYKGRVET